LIEGYNHILGACGNRKNITWLNFEQILGLLK